MKPLLFLSFLIVLMAACTGLPGTANPDQPVSDDPGTGQPSDPFAPQPGDDQLLRGEVYLDPADLLTLESYPLQFVLILKGNLPTPCHQLRMVLGPVDEAGNIQIEAYSVSEPDAVCIAVLEPFEVNLPLGSFPAGHYQVLVNGEVMAEFDA